jgi:hypothetical protein
MKSCFNLFGTEYKSTILKEFPQKEKKDGGYTRRDGAVVKIVGSKFIWHWIAIEPIRRDPRNQYIKRTK